MSMQQSDVGGDGKQLRDLEMGTHKATNHLPGYSGFIPSVASNRAGQHGRAANTRPDKNALILNETFNPKIKAFKTKSYGSMQTTNSKRTAALEMMMKK